MMKLMSCSNLAAKKPQGVVMINHHIDNAIFWVDFNQHYVDIYEYIFEWDAEDRVKVVFSEDETEFNQNFINRERMEDHFLAYCRDELKYHMHELERSKVRLRICMLTFNKGWVF